MRLCPVPESPRINSGTATRQYFASLPHATARCSTFARQPLDMAEYTSFLKRIGYLLPEPAACAVTTANVDAEIARVAGPQLVVPLSNARYSLNAVNARWGSLYGAFYGTDVIADEGDLSRGNAFNSVRGARVAAKTKEFLDAAWPLVGAQHADATSYAIEGGKLTVGLRDGGHTGLADPDGLAGHQGEVGAPSAVLLRHHGLHAEISIDR